MPHIEILQHTPLIGIDGLVTAEVIPPTWPMHLVEIGWTGLLALSPQAFAIDSEFDVCFRGRGTWTLTLGVRVTYCELMTMPDVFPEVFSIGLTFTGIHREVVVQRVNHLVDLAYGAGAGDDRAVVMSTSSIH